MSHQESSTTFLGHYAFAHMEASYGSVEVRKQFASGVAVHFGEQAMFIPGTDPDKLHDLVLQKIEELACTYTAWKYATEHPQQGDEVS